MRPRTTGVLLVLALVLGASVYFFEIAGEEARRVEDEAGRRVFPGVEAQTIDQIRLITSDGVAVQIARPRGQWQVLSPVHFPADKVNLDAMASTLAGLVSESTLEAAAAPEVYGLGDAAYRVEFRAQGRDHVLLVGKGTPVGENNYVCLGSAPEPILILPTWKVDTLRQDFAALRDRRVMAIDQSRVEGIAMRWPRGEVDLEKRDAGWFFRGLGGLAGEPADGAVVDALLSSVAFLQATGFDDSGQSDRRAGLDRPSFELSIREAASKDDDPAAGLIEQRILVAYDSAQDRALIRGNYPATLHIVDRFNPADYPRDLFSYRYKQLADFTLAKAVTGELSFVAEGGERIQIERGEAGWRASGAAWRPGMATQLVSRIANLSASGIVAEKLGAQELSFYGLVPPDVRIRIFGAASEEGADSRPVLADVRIGEPNAETGLVAQAAGRDAVYRLDPSMAKEIPLNRKRLQQAWLQPDVTVEASQVEVDVEAAPDVN